MNLVSLSALAWAWEESTSVDARGIDSPPFKDPSTILEDGCFENFDLIVCMMIMLYDVYDVIIHPPPKF